MARSTAVAALALALTVIGNAGAAVMNGGGSAALPGAGALQRSGRAGAPRYVTGGWQCPPGFVWRNAGRTDWLCVEGAEARRVAQENLFAAANWADGRGDSCRPGLVRRDAFKGDPVCVDPSRRERVREMNLALYDVR